MEKSLHDLGRILLNAIPTFLIVGFLVLYLQRMFFRPLAKVLDQRHAATEGAVQAAEASLKAAEERVAEYEGKLRAARGEVYAQQEQAFQRLEGEHAAQIDRARSDSKERLQKAAADLEEQANQARGELEARSAELADLIAGSVLRGRAA